jgi:hypothetical protein
MSANTHVLSLLGFPPAPTCLVLQSLCSRRTARSTSVLSRAMALRPVAAVSGCKQSTLHRRGRGRGRGTRVPTVPTVPCHEAKKKKDEALPRASSHLFLLRFSGLCPVVATLRRADPSCSPRPRFAVPGCWICRCMVVNTRCPPRLLDSSFYPGIRAWDWCRTASANRRQSK